MVSEWKENGRLLFFGTKLNGNRTWVGDRRRKIFFDALVICPPTKQPHNVLACTKCLPNIPSVVTFYHLTLWRFTTVTFPVMFYYCDILSLWHFITAKFRSLLWCVQVTDIYSHFSGERHATVSGYSPFFLLNYDRTSTFAFKKIWMLRHC
jgi:hypothetical protein